MESDDVIRRYHSSLVDSLENEVSEKEKQRLKSEVYYQKLIEQQEKKEDELKYLVKDKTAKLEQSINEKEQLFENFSHELKTPLTLILGPIEKILKNDLSQELSQELRGIKCNAHRLFDLVQALLTHAELKINKDKKLPSHIVSCTRYIISSLQPLAEQKNINLNVKIQCEKDLTLELQSQTWELLLVNLLTNAIKHGKQRNQIEIVINQNQSHIMLSVSDSNIPISVERKGVYF